MKKPKVSVVIPVYNTETYIKETILCVLMQSVNELEIILVDDGSTDGSLKIINELALSDNRIQVISQPNQGQSAARNVGYRQAIGEFIYFMDSDDLLLPEALQTCYDKCLANTLDFLFFDGDIIYEDQQKKISWDYHRTAGLEDKVYIGLSLFDRMLDERLHRAVPWLLFIRLNFFRQINHYFYSGIIHEDEHFTPILFMEAKRVGCIQANFAIHRVRANSTMTSKYSLRNVLCYLTVADLLLTYVKEQNPDADAIVDKFLRYTLNPAVYLSFSFPLGERLKVIQLCMSRHCLKYLTAKTVCVLLFKSTLQHLKNR